MAIVNAGVADWLQSQMIRGQPLRFISGHNIGKGDKSPSWRGGQTTANGYAQVMSPGHPKSGRKGYVYEHILIAEKALGKLLPDKVEVHHYTPKQLVVCQDHAYHMFLHQRQRAYETCGHADWRKCRYCKLYDDLKNMTNDRGCYYHKTCRNKSERNSRIKSSNGGKTFEGNRSETNSQACL